MTIPEALEIAVGRHQAGRLGDAEALYRQVLAAQPNHPDALHFLGVIALQIGRHDLAVDLIRRSIVVNPNNPVAHSNLGEACRAIGRLDEAVAACRRALELKPDYADAHYNLGIALQERGQLEEAIGAYRRAIELEPNFADVHYNLGIALQERRRFEQAAAAYRRALELKPDHLDAQNNLGNALRNLGQLDEALIVYRRALELKADCPNAWNNLGNALKDLGRLDEAVAAFRRALPPGEERPELHSNLVYTLHFHPGYDARMIAEERQRWNQRFGAPLKRLIQPHANDRNPDRPLRIGYVSPDFRDHVVGRNLIPLFRHHDRRNCEILCYSGVLRPDSLTDEFRRHALLWRDMAKLGDETLADRIRQDGVDILVDLTQHLDGNRLPLFARQPAPVQASFAGYPESAGLEAIRYRISDRNLEADVSEDETGGREKVCLIDSFWCYDPCGAVADVNRLPAKEIGRVTFGCLNNFCKVNECVLSLWARVLRRVKDSRLVMRVPGGSPRQRTLDALEREGVEGCRIDFVKSCSRQEYLELYHRLDIVLDTMPYNGHTTSLDALWMGVPVVSLAGRTPVSRAGLSQLTNLGLPEWAAHSEADYVDIAGSLAGDLPRLAELRSTLRGRMENSVLMDAPRFARNVETAYRSMWLAWLARQPPAGKGI